MRASRFATDVPWRVQMMCSQCRDGPFREMRDRLQLDPQERASFRASAWKAGRSRVTGFVCAGLAALALLSSNPPAFSEEPTGPNALLTRFFHEVRQLQADFTQLEYDGEGVFQRESTGRLYLSRPGRFRLDYLAPDELIIWADGERLSLFDKELEQVTVYRQTERLRESAAALLAGDASVLANYQVIEAEFEEGLQWFDLTGSDAAQGDMRLALRGSVPAALEYSDDLGSRVRMLLFRLDLESELDEAVFAPTIPPGTDIFEAAES